MKNFQLNAKPKLVLPGVSKIITEYLENIYYCEADDCYTRLYLVCGKYHLATRLLKDVEESLLPFQIIRCHRSFLINIQHIKEFDKKNNKVILTNGMEIPVSEKYRKEVMKTLYQNTIAI